MNKLLLLFLCALAAPALSAQSLPPEKNEAIYVMEDDRVVGIMELDTAQRRQLITIERRYQQRMDELADNDTLERKEAEELADNHARERHEGIKALLTPEQYENWIRLIADAEVQ